MQISDPRHQFYLCRGKIIFSLLLFLGINFFSFSQKGEKTHLINYDDSWIHYGFLLGVHSSKYIIKYSEAFTTASLDTIHSIIPGNTGGFKTGFIINMRISQNLNFRIIPTIGFYENDLTYRFTDGTIHREVKDATILELPLLLKFKSARRGNLAMYTVAGINPSFEAVSSDDKEETDVRLELQNWNIAFDVGVGLDIYFEFFKFSPEIRYSYGLRNILTNPKNDFSVGLESLKMQNLGIFLTFEGGIHNKGKKLKGKKKTRKKKK